MSKLLGILTLFVFVTGAISQLAPKEWWENAIFYQIYPRSFFDSNGDGVGDLNGVTEKLAYLKEIGVGGTWLSPIMKSPMADFGYDISDFYNVDPIFGTMADCDNMFKAAQKHRVRLIMDLVPNHSSDENEWFIKSAARDPEYKDYYVWHPGKMVNGTRQPPTNWVSVFRGPAWTFHEQRQEYYLHQFLAKQPDLNYRDPKVVAEMKNVIRFWIEKGASGFRVDAVPHLFEVAADANGNYPDEPRSSWGSDPESYDYLDHLYTRGQPETFDMMFEFRQHLDDLKAEGNREDLILMLEADDDLSIVKKYFGNATVEGAQLPFNFQLLHDLNSEADAYRFKEVVYRWLAIVPEGKVSNWVLGNHDQPRIGTRSGEKRIDIMNILTASLPGCMITYNGEEIGMTNVDLSWEQTVDPQACQASPELLQSKSRDPERTPMQWTDGVNAGFTNGRPWLPVSNNSNLINVKLQRAVPRSHLNVYKKLHALRQLPTFTHGALDMQTPNENVVVIKRSLNGYPTYISLLNLNKNLELVNLESIYSDLGTHLQYVLVTDRTSKRIGDTTPTGSVLLMPNEGAVFKTV